VQATRKSLVFLGSKPIGYACLEYLLHERHSLNVEVAGILTQARTEFGLSHDLTGLAVAAGIPVISSLDELPPCDFIYSVQYHRILKQQHINKGRVIAVNLHMAPLPEYRGSNQFSFAIIDGKHEFGTTIHRIDTGIDHGDILFERRFPIPDDCWIEDLYQLTYDASLALFKESLPKVLSGDYMLTPQSALIENRGTSLHFRKEISALKQIDLSWSEDKISRHIRATSMPGFEPPYTILGDKKIYFSSKQ